eukprot:GHVR01101529.1.p1 GENE.GHVR01101529.1~~GHVR01101529.1.p1  ORF type:complete len:143 (+),score=14.84 GHVR01101529.1:2925-3353(+)
MKPVYPYPLIYKDRIYYLKDEEEREYVMRNPKSLEQNQAIPLDVHVTPIIFVTGKAKIGCTTLTDILCNKLGFVKVDVQKIIEEFSLEHRDYEINEIINSIKSGKTLSDEAITTLIHKRTSLYDCRSNGWVLDGFPKNKNQC